MSDQGREECAALNVREFLIKRMEDLSECQTVQINNLTSNCVARLGFGWDRGG
jgi:hypothetical protein